MHQQWQYQPLAEPVQITVSSPATWGIPLSEPNRRNPLAAIVLAAQIGYFGPPVVVPPPPTDAPWFQALSEPKRFKLGLRPSEQQFIAFQNWQPFIPLFDPFVETAWERAERKKRRFEDRDFTEELDYRNHRRRAIAEAVIGPFVPMEWTGVPVLVSTPQTRQLTQSILQAKADVNAIQLAQDDDDIEDILKDV